MHQLTAGSRDGIKFFLRRKIHIQQLAGPGAGSAPGQPFYQDVEIHIHQDRRVERGLHLVQQFLKINRLLRSARESVEDKTIFGVRLRQAFTDNAQHDLVRYQVAGIHDRFRLEAESRAACHGFAQHIPG